MLLFSTILGINDTMKKDDFIRLVIEWNCESEYQSNIIPNLQWNGEYNKRFGDENLWLDIQEYRNENIVAVRYEKRTPDGVIWDTDYVMNFNSMKMSIRLDRSYREEALTMDPKFSTPHFITLLINHGYLEDDGIFPVEREPVFITDDRIEILAEIINGKVKYRLPVVYVSKTYSDENPVSVEWLASRLKGVAHVLVEESTRQNKKLKELCNRKNEYYGAIGVYFFNKAIGNRRFLYHKANGESEILLEKVIRLVIQYSNSQLVDTLYTWQGVNNALLRDRLASQIKERLTAELSKKFAEDNLQKLKDSRDEEESQIRKEAKEEADLILDSFESDLEKLHDQIDALTRDNERLQYENQGMKNKLDNIESRPILFAGEEDDFYPGELKDLILSVLSNALKYLPEKSRKTDVVRDIVEANNYEKTSEQRAKELKELLNNYSRMTPKLHQKLKELGLEITDEGKHYKVTYFGDGRYETVYAKTPSDYRAGKNNVQTSIKLFF